MRISQIIFCVIYLALSGSAFLISYRQFQEKGFLFNNGWLWANREARQRMSREDKRPLYRQSGVVFLLLGSCLLTLAVITVTDWTWLFFVFVSLILLTIVYAVASSIKMEQHT